MCKRGLDHYWFLEEKTDCKSLFKPLLIFISEKKLRSSKYMPMPQEKQQATRNHHAEST